MALARVTRIWFDQPQKDRTKETQWYVVHLVKIPSCTCLIMDQNYNHWERKTLAILEIVIPSIDRKGEFFQHFLTWRLFCFTFVTFVLTQTLAISFSGVISNAAIKRVDGRASRHFKWSRGSYSNSYASKWILLVGGFSLVTLHFALYVRIHDLIFSRDGSLILAAAGNFILVSSFRNESEIIVYK